ncbi:hypothetical protein AMTR_s00032p00219670 [Amborella trichopoda]|uniref:Cytochrome P450 n=2 Tax=Amborella trichopoda TaxID=13333 RepID=U5CYC7_AMBTC|nr:hypothetical protein AMTR_s00032p00219670 [Amborella trichopoda]
MYFCWEKLVPNKSGRLPPGPTGLPIVGSLHKLGAKPNEALTALARTHGPIMTLRLGFLTTVVVSSSDMAREVLQKNDQAFAGRVILDAVTVDSHHNFSIAWGQVGPYWRTLRRLCNTQLFTTQRLDALQALRHRKVHELLELVDQYSDARKAVHMGRMAFVTSLNLLSNMIFSSDMVDPQSESVGELKELIWSIMEGVGTPNIADYFPFLRPLDPQGIKRKNIVQVRRLHQLLNEKIDERVGARERGQPIYGDFIDVLLDYSDQESGSKFSRAGILAPLVDMYLAGSDTTATTLEWAMAELLHNPEKMAAAKQELKENIAGSMHTVQESDLGRLPYLQAVVKETLRLHPPVPLLLPHRADVTVKVSGYVIPEHTQVLVNAWAIGRDVQVWENPTAFIPERFVGSNIDFKGRDFQYIPFGAGRRICPGLPLGVRMVHIMLASLLHSFYWELPDGLKPEEMDIKDKFGVTLQKAVPLVAVPVKYLGGVAA